MGRVMLSGRWVSMVEAERAAKSSSRVLSRTYHRDQDGQFSAGSGVEEGDVDEGDFGYGVDPKGVSYTEYDVNEGTGTPKFSSEYRDKYGPLESNTTFSSGIAVAKGSKGKLHVADDSGGTMNRRVVQELTAKQSEEAGVAIYSVYSGMINEGTTSTGIHVRASSADPRRDGVEVTWKDGTKAHFDGEAGNDEAFELQEALNLA